MVPLPPGVARGQDPQLFELEEQQVSQFEEDGVILIRGAVKNWVEFLRATTEHQLDNPHLWSLWNPTGYYEYYQRNVWTTNNGYRDFFYYSQLGHILAQLGRLPEVRLSTDVLLINPTKDLLWHQDSQNGPIDLPDGLRWWVAMDPCGEGGVGAPHFLRGSHRNTTVGQNDSVVDLELGDLPRFAEQRTRFLVEPGDVIVWDVRTVHRVLAPPAGTVRRALAGTAAKAGAIYRCRDGYGSSDYMAHGLEDGAPLGGPYFPRLFPAREPAEEACRAEGSVLREPRDATDAAVGSLASFGLGLLQRLTPQS